MELYLTATSSMNDLTIDFIEIRLISGELISLNWDESFVDRFGKEIRAHYVGLCFNEKNASGQMYQLKGMRVVSVGLYSEKFDEEGVYPIDITEMEFYEQCESLCFENPFTQRAPNALQQLHDKFLASSWR